MKKAFLVLFFALTLVSCGKDSNIDPVFNHFPLIGTWISSTGTPIMQIKNLTDEGTTERYLEYREGSSRLLRRKYNDYPTLYEIIFINDLELRLVERHTGALITLYRAKGW